MKVSLPQGCKGLDMQDGTTYKARGGVADVSDEHGAALKRGYYGQSGMITAQSHMLGTKNGRECPSCRRRWQGWTTECRICHVPTVPEGSIQ